jgi:FecR protein
MDRRVRILAIGLAVLAAGVTCSFPAVAAPLYGNLVVQQGEMTIVRDGQLLQYKASPTQITVEERDLLRVRSASKVVMTTRDHATLTLGSNAILNCIPWSTSKSKGILRVLFGRMQAKVQGAAGQEFAIKTSTATIGVKGTEYRLAETSNGNSVVLGVENTVIVTGDDGVEQRITANQVSAVVAGAPATRAEVAPAELVRELADLDSPDPDAKEALQLPAESVLVDRGILSKESLLRSKAHRAMTLDTHGIPIPTEPMNLDDSRAK